MGVRERGRYSPDGKGSGGAGGGGNRRRERKKNEEEKNEAVVNGRGKPLRVFFIFYFSRCRVASFIVIILRKTEVAELLSTERRNRGPRGRGRRSRIAIDFKIMIKIMSVVNGEYKGMQRKNTQQQPRWRRRYRMKRIVTE